MNKLKKLLVTISIYSLLAFNLGPVFAEDTAPSPSPVVEATSTPPPPSPPALPTPPPVTTPPPVATPPPTHTCIIDGVSVEVAAGQNCPSPPATPPPVPNSPPPAAQTQPPPADHPRLSVNQVPNPHAQNIGGNVGDTTVHTGDAINNAILNTAANLNSAAGSGSNPGTGATIINDHNGQGSTNNGSATVSNNNSTNQQNGAQVLNNLNLGSASGSNNVNGNTAGDVGITSGKSTTTGTAVTLANTNASGVQLAEFNVVDNLRGDLVLNFDANCTAGCGTGPSSASNTNNGQNSKNNALINQIGNNALVQNNTGEVGSNLTLAADSGHNNGNGNTLGDTTIQTGVASTAGNLLTFLNNNLAGKVIFGTVNIIGNLIGDIILPGSIMSCDSCGNGVTASNVNNGAGSGNASKIQQSKNSTSTQANLADIQNNLNLSATTGSNNTSGNTGGDSTIQTGKADVKAQGLNIVNTNLDGGNMWLVLVNKAGTWIGKILGSAGGSNFAGSAGTEFTTDANGNVTATNFGNGQNSNNNSTVSSANSSTTSQQNSAKIVNNLNLTANSGGNSASGNTAGNSSITTQDAKVIANLVNFVNNNIKGKLVVTMVNIFGSWTGDFIAPGQHKQSALVSPQSAENHGPIENNSPHDNNSNPTIPATTQTITTQLTASPASHITVSTGSNNSLVLGISGSNPGEPQTLIASQTETKAQAHTPVTVQAGPVPINLAWLLLIIPAGVLGLLFYRKAYHFTL